MIALIEFTLYVGERFLPNYLGNLLFRSTLGI